MELASGICLAAALGAGTVLFFRLLIRLMGGLSFFAKPGEEAPPLGGLLFSLAVLVSVLFSADTGYAAVLPAMVGLTVCTLWGFLTDFQQVRGREGLPPWVNGAVLLAIAVGLPLYMALKKIPGTVLFTPFTRKAWSSGLWFFPLGLLVLVPALSAAPASDTPRGCGGRTRLSGFAVFALVCSLRAGASLRYTDAEAGCMAGMAVFSGACFGALLGLLLFDRREEKLLPGFSGHYAVAAATCMAALNSGHPLLLLCTDLWSVLVCLSLAGKKVKLLSPLRRLTAPENAGRAEDTAVSLSLLGALAALTFFFL